ncbi:hypothetical protein GUJ93_ZPchr0006g42463 [Zizania palustris]|uniref:Uncharacterized protein n=1 Tax=Zizania palustris TaxID=103762 RepID=A0A8J5SV01_ZIZPA|nr:hypothetical protein GUJ93_ZPchr0006g42463 [Zizania palustris]
MGRYKSPPAVEAAQALAVEAVLAPAAVALKEKVATEQQTMNQAVAEQRTRREEERWTKSPEAAASRQPTVMSPSRWAQGRRRQRRLALGAEFSSSATASSKHK